MGSDAMRRWIAYPPRASSAQKWWMLAAGLVLVGLAMWDGVGGSPEWTFTAGLGAGLVLTALADGFVPHRPIGVAVIRRIVAIVLIVLGVVSLLV